jgi:hypothetical protein
MKINRTLSGLAMVASMFMILATGCASSSQQLEQPPNTSYMKSAVGTPNELSPMAPPEAKNIRKVGNQWQCEINGQEMRYNPATAHWENMAK